jgi:MOSC domain-containing protein YiiM
MRLPLAQQIEIRTVQHIDEAAHRAFPFTHWSLANTAPQSTGEASLLNPASPLARLLAAPMRPGEVTWIGLRPARRQPLLPVPLAALDPANGLAGDHGTSRTRQVTLIQQEHLSAIAAYLGLASIDPAVLRRNILVRGINLHALKHRTFHLGSTRLLATGDCHPCSRMEELLGPGGYNAVRFHGGITARVLAAGHVRIGDAIHADNRLDGEIEPAPP